MNCCYRSLKGKASIVNPVNKLYSLTYKVLKQTFFILARKSREHDTCLLLKSYYSYMETYFILLLKMRNLSQNSSSRGIKLEEAS